MKVLITVAIIVIICLICILYTPKNKGCYSKINKEIDDEHESIFIALKKIKDICKNIPENVSEYNIFKKNILDATNNMYNISKNHWDTEQKYFDYGNENKPASHRDIDDQIQKHINEHNETLRVLKIFYDAINGSVFTSVTNANSQIDNILVFIDSVETNIKDHIEKMDVPHFRHWAKSFDKL
jgi:hypothetical protein